MVASLAVSCILHIRSSFQIYIQLSQTPQCKNLFQLAQAQDKLFIDSCKQAVDLEIAHVKALRQQQPNQSLRDIPHMFKGVNIRRLKKIVDKTIPVYTIKAITEKLLWHQRLGHPCNEYLYNAHKFITGVPKFDRQTPVLDECPTCIQGAFQF